MINQFCFNLENNRFNVSEVDYDDWIVYLSTFWIVNMPSLPEKFQKRDLVFILLLCLFMNIQEENKYARPDTVDSRSK